MFNYIAKNTGTSEPTVRGTDATTETEQRLTTEITELWAVHTDVQSAVNRTQQELKAIRQSLGERLYSMKQLLAKPGCKGEWTSFLSTHGISRTTADRLCASHEKSLGGENGTIGAVRELTDDEIVELAKATWKKLEKKLGSKRVVYSFLGRLIAESGLSNFKFNRGDQRGLALVNPDADSTAQATAATDASAAPPTNAA